MKKYFNLFITFLSFSIFTSCGNTELTEPYDFSSMPGAKLPHNNAKLLPLEIIQSKISANESNSSSITSNYQFEFDKNNRLINIFNGTNSLTISYNVETDKVLTLESKTPQGVYKFIYQYVDDETIFELVYFNNKQKETNTLTLDENKMLTSKYDAANNILTEYEYDTDNNLIAINDEHYSYDDKKGWMSSVNTPHWLFHSHANLLPGAFNLINNLISINIYDDEGNIDTQKSNVINYTEHNAYKFPTYGIDLKGNDITIKYTVDKK